MYEQVKILIVLLQNLCFNSHRMITVVSCQKPNGKWMLWKFNIAYQNINFGAYSVARKKAIILKITALELIYSAPQAAGIVKK